VFFQERKIIVLVCVVRKAREDGATAATGLPSSPFSCGVVFKARVRERER